MSRSNNIQDTATREAVKEIEMFMKSIESIQPIKVPDTADETTRVIIQSINKITNSFKRRK